MDRALPGLIERETEASRLADLVDGLRGAASTPGRCVLLYGEAGVGKTSLLRAVAARPTPDVQWLWGGCEPLLAALPLGPLIDLLDHLPPSLGAAVRSGRHTPDVLAGVLALLRERATPVVLVIDDVQWADSATLDLLRYLGRRIAGTRALLVLSYRDDELAADHPLRAVVGVLPAAATLRVPLAPLSRTAVAELARRAGRPAEGLFRTTRGNPFFVTELLAGRAGELPASVRDAVLARTVPLSGAARDVLELAAVVPMPLEFELLDTVLAPEPGAIDECLRAGLLEADGETLRFRHELARRSVESALATTRAASLHEQVYHALCMASGAAAPGAALRRVHHAERAGMHTVLTTVAQVAAREAAAASAHRQAATLYALALAHADALPRAERAALAVAHADECQRTPALDDAVAARRFALDVHRELGDRAAQGADLRVLARLHWLQGSAEAGKPFAQAAVDVLEPLGPGHELAMAYATMAQLHLLDEPAEAARRWGRRALALAEDLQDVEALTYALNTVGTAELDTADRPESWARLRRSLALALEHGLEEHAARAYTNLVALALAHRHHAQVPSLYGEGLAFCEARDLDLYVARLRLRRAWGALETGPWSEARAELDQVATMPGNAPLEQEHLAYLGALLALRRGEPGARAYWLDLIAGRSRLRSKPWFAPPAVLCAEAAWLLCDADELARVAAAGLAVALRLGEPWRIGQLCVWLQRAGHPVARPDLALPAPSAAELAGDPRAAAAAWAALGCRHEQALALLGGDEAALREALALFEELGAAPAAAVARARLRDGGARQVPRGPNARTRDDPLQLTARERQVLELLAQGLSNRAIAQRLHRSPRTVENHVAALLAKLGVASRAEAVALRARGQIQVV